MGNPLKNPPVYLTLAQVRFNPILKLFDFLPSVQENFRQAGYPDFERQQLISIEVTLNEGQQKPNLVPQDRFQFGNVEKTHMFILDGQSLTLQSTNYGHFEKFSKCFQCGLKIVNDVVKLAFIDRVGLRYLDRVMPNADEPLELYLAEQVQGLASRLGGRPVHTFTEALNEVDNIKLLSRVAIQDGPLAFPSDLHLRNMEVAKKFVAYDGRSAILDNDGFLDIREVFDATRVAEHLDRIHNVIGAAFKATATPHAFSTWDIEE